MVNIKQVNIEEAFSTFEDTLRKEPPVYVANLLPKPLVITTGVITLAAPVAGPDGEPLPSTVLKLPLAANNFFADVEVAIKNTCIEKKAQWFKESLSNDALHMSFKSFLHEDCLSVRVDEGVTAFGPDKTQVPLPEENTKVKAVLELSRITFGKTEFGAKWKLRQLKVMEVAPKYLFDDEDIADTLPDTEEEDDEACILPASCPCEDIQTGIQT